MLEEKKMTLELPSTAVFTITTMLEEVAVVQPTDYASLPELKEIKELKEFIQSDTHLYMMFNQMFVGNDGLPLAPHVRFISPVWNSP
jgi:hypothetical protein